MHQAAAVEGAVLDGFGEVGGGDVGAGVEVGDGARELQDAVVGARGEMQLVDGGAQQRLHGIGERAELADVARAHLRVVRHRQPGKAALLDGARLPHALAHGRRGFARLGGEQLVMAQARHLDVDVDAVENGAAEARLILRHLRRRAGAGARGVAKKSAGT